MIRIPKLFAIITIFSLPVSCSAGNSSPSESDIEAAFGIPVHDTSCVEAQGKPGYMCTFLTDGENWTITRRLIRTESGWRGVDGN